MLEKITNYLKKKEWSFTPGKEAGVLYFPIKGFNATFHCAVDVTPSYLYFLFITFNGTSCPHEKRLLMAELFNRINFRLKYGNFEVGMETGEIKFRTCICYESMEINDTIIENVILKNIFMHDFSFPFISKFIYGDMQMAEACDSIIAPPISEEKESKLIVGSVPG
jgi:hypothetical protein